MNKYQEALDIKLEKNHIIDLHLDKFPEAQEALYKNEEFKENINKTEEFSNKYHQCTVDALQELVDKETPKKPIYKDDGTGDHYYFCGNCDAKVPLCSNLIDQIKYKHCPYCGREIYWGDKK